MHFSVHRAYSNNAWVITQARSKEYVGSNHPQYEYVNEVQYIFPVSDQENYRSVYSKVKLFTLLSKQFHHNSTISLNEVLVTSIG